MLIIVGIGSSGLLNWIVNSLARFLRVFICINVCVLLPVLYLLMNILYYSHSSFTGWPRIFCNYVSNS